MIRTLGHATVNTQELLLAIAAEQKAGRITAEQVATVVEVFNTIAVNTQPLQAVAFTTQFLGERYRYGVTD